MVQFFKAAGKTLMIALLISGTASLAAEMQVAVIASPGIHHVPKAERVKAVAQEIAVDYHLPTESLPNLVVLFVTKDDARAQQIQGQQSIVVNRMTWSPTPGVKTAVPESSVPVFHLWIIDGTSEVAIAEAVSLALNLQTGMYSTHEEVLDVGRRGYARMASRVSVQALRERN